MRKFEKSKRITKYKPIKILSKKNVQNGSDKLIRREAVLPDFSNKKALEWLPTSKFH